MNELLDQPVILVGGINTPNASIAILAHRGFDRDAMLVSEGLNPAAIPNDGMPHLVHGDLKRPLFSWPVYAVRTDDGSAL